MEKILHTTIDRILYFADSQGMSIRAFAKTVGISHSLLGKTKALGSDKLEKILSIYPGLNPVWLLTGKGEMLEKKSEDFDHPKQENAIPKMQSQNAISKHQNAIPKRHSKNRHIEYDDSLSHLTGDFAAPDSEPAGEKVYIALLEAKDRTIAAKDEIIRAKDEIIATKEAQIIDLRSFVDDMRKQTAVVQSNLDELREAMREAQKATKKASVVHDAEDVVASRK
ncbi:hypothetical protein [uncultured Rikenella sp.]|uniref:hypothetical protein n=1 Tax=uncultured Rikenella sp. TaxID=368003 RepID=UPI0026137775|nr:hypothetical protein [uncultured Rikenella sp.]